MSKFKVGDRVKIIDRNCSGVEVGEIGTLVYDSPGKTLYAKTRKSIYRNACGCTCENNWRLINNQKLDMAKVKKVYYVEIDSDGEVTGAVWDSKEEMEESLSGGEIILEVAVVKKFHAVEASISLKEA